VAEVWFYHMTESRLEDALPALLEKTLERGWRAVVEFGSEERLNQMNEHLWTFREDSFLPHGTAADGFEADQPIYLTLDAANPNSAEARFHVDGSMPHDVAPYVRTILMFDGHDNEQKAAARLQWTRLKGDGHAVSYWKQADDRRWQKQN
jgi:DNA polymerase-3 subunit chi